MPIIFSGSTFLQKGCGQLLSGTSSSSTTSDSINDCTQYCALDTSCLGVNYNPTSQLCETLDQNTCTQGLVCSVGWNYYERI